MTIERLNQVNDVKVLSVNSPEFAPYGRIVTGYDFSGLIKYMENEAPIPENGNVYLASVPEMEADPVKEHMENVLYGGMPIQIGYCNGRNTSRSKYDKILVYLSQYALDKCCLTSTSLSCNKQTGIGICNKVECKLLLNVCFVLKVYILYAFFCHTLLLSFNYAAKV